LQVRILPGEPVSKKGAVSKALFGAAPFLFISYLVVVLFWVKNPVFVGDLAKNNLTDDIRSSVEKNFIFLSN